MLVILELDRYVETKNVEGVQKVNVKNVFYNAFKNTFVVGNRFTDM